MKKRFLSLLMICALICAMIVPAQAASASLSGNNAVKAGDSVVLTLKVSGNIYGLSGTLSYSDNLTFTNYSCSASGWSMEANGTKFSAFGTSATSGAILTVTLKVSSSAKSGDTFSASFKDIVVSDGESDTSLDTASWSGSVAAPPSNNCDLDLIICNSGTLVPAFNKNTTYYTVTVPYSVEKLVLDYNRADQGQTVTISGNSLVVGQNTITFTVKAASGATKTYTIVATREQDPNYVPSSDATLKEMTVEGATLSPAFSPDVTEYVAYVPFEQRTLTLRGVPNDTKAAGVAERVVELPAAENIPAFAPVVDEETGATIPVTTYAAEDTTAMLVCTAEDGTTVTYTVHVVRMPAYTGGVPQIHMTNESDLQDGAEEDIPEEEKPFEVPKTLTLPLVGEMATKLVVLIGGAVALVLMLLIGFLLGRIGRKKVYVDEYEDDEDEAPLDEPTRPLPVAEPALTSAPAKPEKPSKPAKKAKAFDFDAEEDDFERRLESVIAAEHKVPPVETPAVEEPAAPAFGPVKELPMEEPAPLTEELQAVKKPDTVDEEMAALDDELSHMSLGDLLDDIRNM